MREMIARNRIADGLLYLQVTRGAARRDHVLPEDAAAPDFDPDHARRRTWPRWRRGWKMASRSPARPDQRWARCDIKTVQLLPNLLAKQAAKAKGAFEAWLVDDDGFVTEGALDQCLDRGSAGDVVTRELSQRNSAGVTRRIILEAVAEAGLAGARAQIHRRGGHRVRAKPSCHRPPGRRCRW